MKGTKRIQAVNDFVVKFANVNGSGSASANELFAKAVMRMGVPVSPRNIFPSNIQGLPTWYEVRVSEQGWLGRRGGIDMMVAMNPQTWDADVAEIESGGYLFYDSSRPTPPARFREDVHVIGVPLTEIANRDFTDPRQRQLFKNIIYVGVLSALLDIDVTEIDHLSLFAGEITLDSARGSVSSAGTVGDLSDSTLTNLVVAGAPVGVAPNARVPVADWGYALLLPQ